MTEAQVHGGPGHAGEECGALGWVAGGWILFVSGLLVCCAWLEAESTPTYDVVMMAAAVVASVLIGLAWLLWTVMLVGGGPRSWRHMAFAALLPAVALGTASLLAQGVPLAVRFELSRGAFEDAAARIEASGPASDMTIGLYEGVAGSADAGVVLFSVPPTAMLHDAGFAHCPSGCPVDAGYHFRHLSGDWYVWVGD